jgi:hypothetical protein
VSQPGRKWIRYPLKSSSLFWLIGNKHKGVTMKTAWVTMRQVNDLLGDISQALRIVEISMEKRNYGTAETYASYAQRLVEEGIPNKDQVIFDFTPLSMSEILGEEKDD